MQEILWDRAEPPEKATERERPDRVHDRVHIADLETGTVLSEAGTPREGNKQ